ncbi:MAG: hypothetical protein NTNFB01_16910 [Nitrospira sp.]
MTRVWRHLDLRAGLVTIRRAGAVLGLGSRPGSVDTLVVYGQVSHVGVAAPDGA